MVMNNTAFMEMLSNDFNEIQSIRGKYPEGSMFEIWFGSKILLEDEGKLIEEYIIGSANDNKIDIGICDSDHDVKFIIQCKYSSNPNKTYDKDVVDELLNAQRRLETIDNEVNGNQKFQEFRKKYNEDQEKPVKKVLAIIGKLSIHASQYAIDNGVEVYDTEKLIMRYIYNEGAIKDNEPELINLEFNNKDFTLKSNKNFEIVNSFINIKQIFNIVSTHQDSIFSENLRFRLTGTSKSKIGKDIKNTILEEPQDLLAFNNGLTITCNSINFIEKSEKSILEIHKPQIVNGCQTSWAIFDSCEELKKADKLDSLDCYISVKIIRTNSDQLIEKVTKATNSQNPISERDLYSNKPEQSKIHAKFNSHKPKVLYEYKAGLYEVVKRNNNLSLYQSKTRVYRRINNEFSGQLYLALLGKPSYSKNNKKQIFENKDFYTTIFHCDIEKSDRFTNQHLNIQSSKVMLESGYHEFVEDIIFSFGVYHFAEMYKNLYNKKLEIVEPNADSVAFQELKRKEYLKLWHYYVVYAISLIIDKLSREKGYPSKIKFRELLLGNDINIFWDKKLWEKFNVNESSESYIILDENRTSSEYNLIGTWLSSLDQIFLTLVRKEQDSSNFSSFRKMLDLDINTVENFRKEIELILSGPQIDIRSKFPIESN